MQPPSTGRAPVVPGTRQPYPEEAIGRGELRGVAAALEDGQLLVQGGVLKNQVTAVGNDVAELNGQYGEQAEDRASLDSDRFLGPHRLAAPTLVWSTRNGGQKRSPQIG